MSKQSVPMLVLTVAATGAIGNARFVTPLGAQAGAGVNALGVSRIDVAAAGASCAVTTLGTEIVEAGAAIAAGALLESDAQGRAITRATGAIVGRTLQAASAAGDFIEVHLIPN